MSDKEVARLTGEIEELNKLVTGISKEQQRIVVNLNDYRHTLVEARRNVEESETALEVLDQARKHLRRKVRVKTEAIQVIRKGEHESSY